MDKKKGPKTTAKKSSIFSQRMAHKAATMGKQQQQQSSDDGSTLDEDAAFIQMTRDIGQLMAASGLDSDEISQEDILEMKKELLKKLSKKDIEFLRSQMAKKELGKVEAATTSRKAPQQNNNNNNSPNPPAAAEARVVRDLSGQKNQRELPIDPDTVKIYPHMDRVEIPKLEWTMVSSKTSQSGTAAQPTNSSNPVSGAGDGAAKKANNNESTDIQARFDLTGDLIDLTRASDLTWLKGLHNHGEEMDQPGYTFEELLGLARSTVPSQRAVALNAIADIFKNAHEGIFDTVLTVNPLDLLANVDVIHVIRKSLDFTDVITLDAACACLSAILFPTAEEECYDFVYLYPDAKPFLWHKVINENSDSLTKDPTTRDHQICQLDLISFLINRSHLLERIEYLLLDRKDRVTNAMEISMLQILIRIARHSPDRLIKADNLLEHIVTRIMKLDWTTICSVPTPTSTNKSNKSDLCNPVAISIWMAMKMFRVLVESSYENAKKVHEEHLMTYVISYLASDYQNRYGFKSCCHAKFIVLECFRFWSSSLDLGLGISEFTTIFPLLALNLRQYCEIDTLKVISAFDGYYLAQVFNFLKCILLCGERKYRGVGDRETAWTMVKDLEYFVLTITMNTARILTTSREDWTLALTGVGLDFLTIALQWGKLGHRKNSIMEHVKQLDMTEIIDSLQQHSLILNMTKIKSRYPSNFVSSSAILTSSNVNHIVARKSPFQFYKRWINFLLELGYKKLVFTRKTWEYLEQVADSFPLDYFETFYIRFEQLCLFKLLISANIEHIQLGLLVHLMCTLSKADVCLFKGLLSLIVNHIGTTGANGEAIQKLYMDCYFPNIKTEDIEDVGDGVLSYEHQNLLSKPILFQPFGTKLVNGKFWMLEPLNRLSSRYAHSPRADLVKNLSAVIHETRACLYFIQFFLREPSVFVTHADIVSYYIRITQVFSMGGDVFMEPEIDYLLGNLLRGLLAMWDNFELQKVSRPFTQFKAGPDFSSFPNFLDYYGDLIKEFENLSFCSNVFSAYLLFPLIPSEAREMKLLFWSMQGLPFVRMTLDNNLLPSDYLTKEVETDRALLQLYTLLLLKTHTINRKNNELLFHILDYHVTRGLPVEDMQKVLKPA